MKVSSYVFCFVLSNIATKTYGLELYPSFTNINILETASAITNTTNELFLAFKLKGAKNNPKLRQYSLIHNFFSTLTAKDHDTLNRINIASRFDTTNINNDTQSFMDAINEVLNEDPEKTIEEPYKNNLQEHVSQFLTKLEYLKDSNGVNNNNFNINSQILNILRNEDRYNTTQDEESDGNDSLLSDNEFWVPENSGRRIYQGDKTKIKYFPFMASIQIFNSFQCGGCIIKSDLVITAASCLQLAWNNRFFRENPLFLSVRIGSNFYKGGGESIDVLEVYFHPKYNPKTLHNNICLLRLVRRINFKKSRRVKKIDFDRNPSNLPMTTDGITIVGWGAKGSSNIIRDPWSNQLTFSVLDIYPLWECQDVYSNQYVTQKNFCAGFFSKGSGACNGDVGGPGIVDGILAGIVSFGSPVCGTPDAPTVFTKLGYYTDWIESIIEQDVPHIKQRTTLKTTPLPRTMPRYHTLKPTTFILEPIGADWKPPHINAVPSDSLRILDDENLFKEFLATMFGSQEAKEYEELFVNKANEKTKHVQRQKAPEKHKAKIKKTDKKHTTGTEFVTKTFEVTPYPFTALDNMFEDNEQSKELASDDDDNEELERNILKLFENIDVSDKDTEKGNKKEIEKEITDVSESDALELVLNDEINIPRENKNKNINSIDDSILTLLYLSDSEKNSTNKFEAIGNVIDGFDEHVNEGLSIAVDGFKDMTFRNNGSSSYNFLPKEEMYELLAEAIEDVAQNKNSS